MQHALKQLLTILSVATLAACGNNSTGASDSTNLAKSGNASPIVTTSAPAAGQTLSVDAYRPAAATVATQDSPIKTRDLSAAPTPTNIVLGAPLASQTAAAQKHNQTSSVEDHTGIPQQIGFGRDVVQSSTAASIQKLLKWKTTSSGNQIAAINFNSVGAKGMRVGLQVIQLPETSTLRFYSKGASTAFEVKGVEVLKVLSANLASGDRSDAGRTYWGPLIEGADATIEIDLPSGVNTSSMNVSIPSVSHMFMSVKDANAVLPSSTFNGNSGNAVDNRPNTAETCHKDVSCTTPLPAASDSVAWLVFQKYNPNKLPVAGYDWYQCSGTLLNDDINSGTPYVLTANHCISSQTVASTVYSEWKYRTDACDSTTGTYFPTTTTGAGLLYTAFGTDSTLLKLNGTPTNGVLFSGWDATVPTIATAVNGIHHPDGVAQRMTTGSIYNYIVRNLTTGGVTASVSTPEPGSNMLGVTQLTGTTEGGSSGSGLFNGTNSNPKLIGQLLGRYLSTYPNDSCDDINVKRIYGRFDVAFKGGMSDWLVQLGAKPVYRFYNRNNDSHFYTKSVTESNNIKQYLTHYRFEGPAFNASSVASAGLSPVYRFYNTASDSHFFTISTTERANILANLKHYRDEGIAWYAQEIAGNGAIPLYRFYNTAADVHFFTSSETEKDSIIANLKHFRFEGIRYYVQPL